MMFLGFLVFCGFCLLHLAYCDPPAICNNIIHKGQWEAQDPTYVDYTVFPLKYVIIHHTVTPSCTTTASCKNIVRNIQTYHLDDLDYGDIGYNFLVGGDGKVYEGRGWHKVGAHTYGYNSRSIGIAFIGSFANQVPPVKQLQAAKNLLRCGVELGELDEHYELYGAKQVSATESPGAKLYNKIRKWEHFSTPKPQ